MSFKSVMKLESLQQENRQVIVVEGIKILLVLHNDQVHAVQAQCPHMKFPLTKGTITDENTIICPLHRSEFDLCTGETKCWTPWPPVIGKLLGKVSKEKNLKVYPTQIENGQILINMN